MSIVSESTISTATIPQKNSTLCMNDDSTNTNINLSQFAFLTSPNTMPVWPMTSSPLDAVFPFNAFPATPTTMTTQQFMNSPIFQQTNNQPPIIQPIQIMNNAIANNNHNLLQPLTPSNFSMLYSAMTDNMFSMGNINDITDIHQFNQITNIQNIEDINVNVPISNLVANNLNTDNKPKLLSNNIEQGLVRKSKRGRKRKIKQEDESTNFGQPAKKRRGRKKKQSNAGGKRDDLEVLSERMKERNDKILAKDSEAGFIGIRTIDGEVKVPIPAKIEIEYKIFGDACTDRIEDILQAKGRTRYVRGLSELEKKDRRREQNRNAAARSRARKNAMISKVIQLHQENLGLRAHTAKTISTLKNLREEVDTLRNMVKK